MDDQTLLRTGISRLSRVYSKIFMRIEVIYSNSSAAAARKRVFPFSLVDRTYNAREKNFLQLEKGTEDFFKPQPESRATKLEVFG